MSIETLRNASITIDDLYQHNTELRIVLFIIITIAVISFYIMKSRKRKVIYIYKNDSNFQTVDLTKPKFQTFELNKGAYKNKGD